MPPKPRRPPKGRPRLPGGRGRQLSKSKVIAYTARHKLKVLQYLDKYDDIALTISTFYPELPAAKYNSRRTLIFSWRRKLDKILADCEAPGRGMKKKARSRGVATVLPPHLEQTLVRWVNDLRGEGVPVTPMMLRLQALAEAEDAGISQFKASWCWQRLFKARHCLALRAKTRQGQIRPPELAEIAKKFAKEVQEKAKSLGVTTIYNADQTAVNFEYIPKHTLAKKGSKTVWVKCAGKSKERATVMLLGNSDGLKFPPFVIFKVRPSKVTERQEENDRHGFGIQIWKSISKVQSEGRMRVYGNGKGWWNGGLTVEFLRFHFGSRVEPDKPVLLLLDDFSGHWTDEVVEYAKAIKVTLMKIPPNATSVSQPADTTWNGPVKKRLRNTWIEDLRTQLAARVPGQPFKLLLPSRASLCGWIDSAWDDVLPSTIRAGFVYCGIVERIDPVVLPEETVTLVQADEAMYEAMLHSNMIDHTHPEFGLEEDFDELFRSMALIVQ